MKKIAIVGAGAAGLMAAVAAGEEGAKVTLLEQNPVCGKKISITGKGRCNVTNTADLREMQNKIPRGAKFLLSALYAFPPDEVQDFFQSRGVPLKVERGGRVFPVSDRAGDIVKALEKAALSQHNVTLKKARVLSLEKTADVFVIHTESGEETFDRVLLATGGASYPLTGSDGSGYALAKAMGHRLQSPRPALIPLVAKESLCREAMGLSLKNCAIRVETSEGKKVYEDFGELLFTHFGLSGPVILSASSFLDFEQKRSYRLFLDLKPALTEEALDRRVLSDFAENQNRDFINSLSRLLPQKLIAPLVSLSGIDPRKKVNLITREERGRLVRLLKKIPFTITGTRPLKEAIVTRGGVECGEVNPRTMESRLVPGLYFAGEILDVDALTGGFNLQIAFSTGHLAGKSMT